MRFEKKLIILSGENNAKGTVTLERNAYGTFATFNVYNLPALRAGEYAAGFKNSAVAFVRKMGEAGRVLSRIKIDDIELSELHCVIFDTVNETPLLYGSNSPKKLWQGNMMDGLRSKKVEFQTKTEKIDIAAALPSYSTRPQEVTNYFLDILPKDDTLYMDNAVAEVNYYPSEMAIEVSYTKRDEAKPKPQEAMSDNKNDAKINEEVVTAMENQFEQQSKLKPWEYQKQYIYRYAHTNSLDGEFNVLDESDKNASTSAEIKDRIKQLDEIINNSSNNIGETQTPIKERATISISEEVKEEKVQLKKKCVKPDEPMPAMNFQSVKTASTGTGDSDVAATVPPLAGFTVENAISLQTMQSIFYEQIKSQIEELFKSNPRFELLENMMPETKWIKVDYDNNGKYYVVGLIGEKPDYLCYGVPAAFSPTPPTELNGYCQWLPSDPTRPQGEGFWLMFQDAVSGESVQKY